jgi:hypothetical protein
VLEGRVKGRNKQFSSPTSIKLPFGAFFNDNRHTQKNPMSHK